MFKKHLKEINFHVDLFSQMPILTFFTRIYFCSCQICEIDINQYCACKCHYFSHVEHTDIILELRFSIPKTKDILTVFNYKHETFIYYLKLSDKENESLLVCFYKFWLKPCQIMILIKISWFNFRRQGKNTNFVDIIFWRFAKKLENCEN